MRTMLGLALAIAIAAPSWRVQAATTPDYTAAQLIIFVVPASYADSQHRPLLERPVAGDLVAVAAVKVAYLYEFPSPADLRARLRLDDNAIWQRAIRNTRRQMPSVRFDSGVYGYSSGKPPWAAWAMADAVWWDSPGMQKGGPPIVAPVDKDLLLVAHLNVPGEPRELRADAAAMRVPAERFSQHVFVRRNGAWEVLPP